MTIPEAGHIAAASAAPGRRILVIGFGNPARGDDGLGPALAARLEALAPDGVTVESDYQLTIEDAATVADHDIVVFADAARDAGDAPFYFHELTPSHDTGGSTHSLSPGQVLAIAHACFGKTPRAYLLGMRAFRLDVFAERLSLEAREVLERALEHLVGFIEAERR